jgi:enoyl-CoA hydratase
MTMDGISVETVGKVAIVTLDRPPVNAITLMHYRAIGEVFMNLGQAMDIHCAIFTARGDRAFCAGLDLHEFMAAKAEDDPARAAIVRECFARVRHCAIPVIAAVNGPALGAGAVLAAVCDFRIASSLAKFSMPEINVGRCGGGAHMGRYVPQGMLRKMFFTGVPITAEEAYRVNFADVIVPAERLMESARELAGTIAQKAPLGLRLGKKALNEIEFMPVEDGYAREQTYSTQLMHTEDAREATRAVVEKRPPVFKGR